MGPLAAHTGGAAIFMSTLQYNRKPRERRGKTFRAYFSVLFLSSSMKGGGSQNVDPFHFNGEREKMCGCTVYVGARERERERDRRMKETGSLPANTKMVSGAIE